jgi:hypothetical protein
VKTDLLDHLMTAGYEPEEDGTAHGEDWYILTASGVGSIRVVRSESRTEIHAFDRYMANRWSADLSSAPASVIIATIEAAEWELAGLRGGPITPAQIQPLR